MEEFAKKYFELITNDFASINLTRILNFEDFYAKQIVDSIKPCQESLCFANAINTHKLVVDVGFGGGVPLLPLAFKFPDVAFVGIEARRKKVDVVRAIATKLGLSNVSFVHERVENILFDEKCVITFKAVGEIEKMCKLLSYSAPLQLFFYKGPRFEEKEQIQGILEDWRICERTTYGVTGTNGREFIALASKKVPRGTSKKNKNIVNLSEII